MERLALGHLRGACRSSSAQSLQQPRSALTPWSWLWISSPNQCQYGSSVQILIIVTWPLPGPPSGPSVAVSVQQREHVASITRHHGKRMQTHSKGDNAYGEEKWLRIVVVL